MITYEYKDIIFENPWYHRLFKEFHERIDWENHSNHHVNYENLPKFIYHDSRLTGKVPFIIFNSVQGDFAPYETFAKNWNAYVDTQGEDELGGTIQTDLITDDMKEVNRIELLNLSLAFGKTNYQIYIFTNRTTFYPEQFNNSIKRLIVLE